MADPNTQNRQTMDVIESIEQRVDEAFAAPSFREYQDDAAITILKKLELEDKQVVQLNAPTGSGKSLILECVGKADRGETFFTTPLNSLVDQIDNDEFMADEVITLKGRNNYDCIHPKDEGTPVDKAICQRESDFDCRLKGECPYYGRKADALEHDFVVTNLSYLMAESMIPEEVMDTFGDRSILIVDECQSIEDFALNFVGITISRMNVPDNVWRNINLPPERHEHNMSVLVDWIRNEVRGAVQQERERIDRLPQKTETQASALERLQQFENKIDNFLSDVDENDWIAQYEEETLDNGNTVEKWSFEPVTVGRFLDELLWDRADQIILSSATIPGGGWLDEIGLNGLTVPKINVPSTFPVENRPIVTGHAVGKMTYNRRRDNAGTMAEKIKQIAEHHGDEKGFIHCRSYSMADLLRDAFTDNGDKDWFEANAMVQDGGRREESLEEWKDNDTQLFFSVAMDEGVDLDGDLCRFQVLAKTLYKSMANKRVKYRIEERGDWDWYNRHAAIQIQQAYGRGVRSPDDECVFYILDESAVGLIRREPELFNGWFLDAITDMEL